MAGLDGSPPRPEGPLHSARALGASLLALVQARVELAGVELAEEAEHGKRLVVLAVVAAFFLGAGLVLLAFLVVVLFWDTHRLAAIAGVTLAYSGVGAWALLRLRRIARERPPPFSATRSEFRNDLDMIRGRDG